MKAKICIIVSCIYVVISLAMVAMAMYWTFTSNINSFNEAVSCLGTSFGFLYASRVFIEEAENLRDTVSKGK